MFGMPDDIWVPIKLTIELATISTLALLVVATPLAWWLARSKAWFKEAAAAIVSLPMVLPPTVLGFAHTVGEFGVILMIGGNIPGRTRVMSTAIFDFVETMRWREANLLAGGMVAFAFVVILAMTLLEKRFTRAGA